MNGNAATYRFEQIDQCVMCGSDAASVLGRRLNTHQGLRPRRVTGLATTVVRCDGCGLIYSNPRPVPDTLAEHYDRPPEEYWAEAYFDGIGAGYFADEIALFRDLWTGTGRVRALDIGAGIGKAMEAMTAAGFDTWGLEPSAPFREQAVANGIPSDRLQPAAVEDAAYDRESFDFIAFAAVLEHLHDPAAAIERALGWLSPVGLIHVEVPSSRWLMSRALNTFYRLQGLDYVTNLSPMHPPFHLYEFTPASFRKNAARSGHRVVFDQILGTSTTYLPRLLEKTTARLMSATGTTMQLQVWLGRK